MGEPHFDFDDASLLDFFGAVPLDEPSPTTSAKPPSPDAATLPFPDPEADALPTEGFHPRLRRFDEAA